MEQIIGSGRAYLKAKIDGVEIDVSTIIRYAHYYLRQSREIVEKIKSLLLKWAPGYQYEKDPRLQESGQASRLELKKAIVMSEKLTQTISVKTQTILANPFKFINFALQN